MYVVDENTITAEQWEQSACFFKDYTLYQTWAYQHIRATGDKQTIKRVIIKNSVGRVMLMAQVRLYKIPFMRSYFGYVQHGPLIYSKNNLFEIKEALSMFIEYMLKSKVCIIRLTPYIFEGEQSNCLVALMEECEFKRNNSMPCYYTTILPLKRAKEEIFNNLHRSWRRCLVKAQKGGLKIESGSDQLHWSILKKLYKESMERKNFKGLDIDVFSKTQEHLPASSKIEIVIAKDEEGQPVCAHSTSYLGETALGVIAASNEKGLKMNASHLVWWHTLILAKTRGASIYDLGGIDQKKNYNVYQFKMKMGTTPIKSIGSFDYCSGFLFFIIRDMIDVTKKTISFFR